MTAVAKVEEIERAPAKLAEQSADIATSPGELLRFAIEKGAPVEQLEKILDLHERIRASHARMEFFSALAEFQATCPTIRKNREGQVITSKGGSYSFTYADLDETVQAVRPAAARVGLSFRWDHEVGEKTLNSIFILSHIAGHSERTSYSLPIDNPSGMSPQQKVGAAQTFADRRSMMAGLGLTASDEDAEGEGAADPTPINDDQVTVLSDLIKETKTDLSRVLKFAGVEKLSDIRAADYERVRAALEQKKEKKS